MKKALDVWFKKNFYDDKMTGVAEYKGDRILIRDTDTIAQIEKRVKEFIRHNDK